MKVSFSDSNATTSSFSYVLTNSTIGPVITPVLQEVKLPLISTNIFTPYYNYPLPRHLDLNYDMSIRNQMAKYYFYKTLDKWLYEPRKLGYLLSYLQVSGDKAQVIKNLKDFNIDAYMKDSERQAEIKVEFIEDHVLSENGVYKILKEFVSKESANWYDLQKSMYQEHIMSAIGKYLQDKLRRMIQGEKDLSESSIDM